ncbi:MAG TPA: SpoIID/LytB domain-containing protein, partial [Candidatus Acidoferrales bacterium]|nr:SpoIID/LytB domain-containing protein [Candidatus Acidoferrales bacterium]
MPGRGYLLLLFLLLSGPCASAQDVQIGVLGLFHPHQITLSATRGEAIVVTAADRNFVLAPGSGVGAAEIRISGNALLFDFGGEVVQASEIRAAGRNNGPVNFVLAVPGKISRFYRGTLVVKAVGGIIVPIVTMDLETAVASTVQAESDPDAPPEALKAQAVV